MPEPSPITKPSRSRSHGREARSGVSLKLVDSARAEAKPAMPSRQTAASAPPATITSASSSMIIRDASPIACAPVEHAVTTAWLGPLKPKRIETCPAARLIRLAGMKNGVTRRGPRSRQGDRAVGDHIEPADTRADQHPGARPRLIVGRHPAGILDRLDAGAQRKDDEIVHPAPVLGVGELVGIELADAGPTGRDLSGDLARKVGKRRTTGSRRCRIRCRSAVARHGRHRHRAG